MTVAEWLLERVDRLGPLPFTLEDVSRAVLPKLPPGRMLADSEKRTLIAMAEVTIGDCAVHVSHADAVDTFERFLIQGKSKRAFRMRLLLTLVEYAPIAAYGKPVSRMSLEERRRYVKEKLMKGGFPWSTCAKVRYLAYAGFYGHRQAESALGFVPFDQRPRATGAASDKELS